VSNSDPLAAELFVTAEISAERNRKSSRIFALSTLLRAAGWSLLAAA
jgi:hypothetical protein